MELEIMQQVDDWDIEEKARVIVRYLGKDVSRPKTQDIEESRYRLTRAGFLIECVQGVHQNQFGSDTYVEYRGCLVFENRGRTNTCSVSGPWEKPFGRLYEEARRKERAIRLKSKKSKKGVERAV